MLWTTLWMTLQTTMRVTILCTTILSLSLKMISCAILHHLAPSFLTPIPQSSATVIIFAEIQPCYPSLLLDASGEQAILQPDCRACELFIQQTLRGKKGFLYPERLMWKSSFCIRGRWMWKSSFCIRRGEILWNLSWHVEDVLKKEMSPVWESALFCVEGLWACYNFLSL